MGVSTTTIIETTTEKSRLPKFVRKKEKKDSDYDGKKQQHKPPSQSITFSCTFC
jgi:hypothetical protein